MFLFFLDFENEEKLPRNVNLIIKIKVENYNVLINTISHQLKILIKSLERCIKKVNIYFLYKSFDLELITNTQLFRYLLIFLYLNFKLKIEVRLQNNAKLLKPSLLRENVK